jgi:hypothetical protein
MALAGVLNLAENTWYGFGTTPIYTLPIKPNVKVRGMKPNTRLFYENPNVSIDNFKPHGRGTPSRTS